MNSHHSRQRSADGKMKIYRKPVTSTNNNNAAGNCAHFLPTPAVIAAVSLDKPRKGKDRNANLYACFPPTSNPGQNLSVTTATITDTCLESSTASSSSENYKKSALSPSEVRSSHSTPSSTPNLRQRSHNETAKSESAIDAANHLEALSIDALYDKIRGNADATQSSTTATESSRNIVSQSKNHTARSMPLQTKIDGSDFDEIYFDLSALNINFKQQPAIVLPEHRQQLTRPNDPWRPPAGLQAASPRIPNVFFSFDDNADIYSLHSLPLRSPTTVEVPVRAAAVDRQPHQHVHCDLRQRRQLSQLPSVVNSHADRRCGPPAKPVTYRRQHRPVTATSSSASTQPLLSPAVLNPVIVGTTSTTGGGSITCSRCHKCRCCACREPLGQIERAGRFARYCLEYGTCMWCARQCVSDEEDDPGKTLEKRRTALPAQKRSRRSSSAGFFTGRRLKLAVMSLVCPCLCLYKPLKSGGKVCDKVCKRVLAHRACVCKPEEIVQSYGQVGTTECDKLCVPTESKPPMLLNTENSRSCGDDRKNHDELLFVPATAPSSADNSYDFLSSFMSSAKSSSLSNSPKLQPSTNSSSSSSSTDSVFK